MYKRILIPEYHFSDIDFSKILVKKLNDGNVLIFNKLKNFGIISGDEIKLNDDMLKKYNNAVCFILYISYMCVYIYCPNIEDNDEAIDNCKKLLKGDYDIYDSDQILTIDEWIIKGIIE